MAERAAAKEQALAVAGLVVWWAVTRWIASAASQGHVFYFPDSWNYVVLPSQGDVHPFHGDLIYRLWDVVLAGAPTEVGVLRLQQLAGLVATLAVWWLLRQLVAAPVAYGAALVFAAQPLVVFFERTILTETVALVLVTTILLALGQLNQAARSPSWGLVAWVALLGAATGLLVALRPASRLAAVVPLIVAVALLAVGALRSRTPAARIRIAIGVVVLAASVLPAPLNVRQRNEQAFGAASLTPAGGTAVLAWWGWRLECPTGGGYTPEAQRALEATCEQPEPTRQLMWVEPAVNASMEPHDGFGETQAQLSAAARRSMLNSPLYTGRRFVAKAAEHAVAPVVNLERYNAGEYWMSRSDEELFPSASDWFGTADPEGWEAEPGIFRLVRQSARLPGLLSFLASVVAAGVAVRWLRRTPRAEWRQAALEPSPRAVLLVAALGMVVGNEAVVALGGVPIFRYWVPMLPAIAVAVAISLDYALGRSAPQSTG